ncbi:NAD-dependent epimerase/dehydratase family protein [Sporosarcina sp. BI001-red]|uniref:NAD-dependent epimerase/dehydratase family protein n=1 Tax=Sporosarcina sp. BI001-red TaxID=2282866 RepID=UPI000E25C436|nr:NAD-dependent epimerase/dehydratase family protein [Sporosarcina sp. BI001-red]REB08725.1 NAD-dependent epimerase/dehydratase family protein [Sporosarcina sp. BI001-red]
MKVLVTGGAGFIGSHVVEELLNDQHEVFVIDNCVSGNPENLPTGTKLFLMDINDPRVESVFEQERPDYVIHLAAQASVVVSMNEPYRDFFTNTAGTVNILQLSNKFAVKKFLFASTAAVYGEPSYLPIDENHTTHAPSFYALSKYSAEKYIQYYSKFNALDSCILRFSNVYGPRQNVNGEAGVISIFIDRLLKEQEINIYGGSQTRDFIFVKDIAKACCVAVMGGAKGIFNVSSSIETGVDELFNLISEVSGKLGVKPEYKPERVGDIQNSVLDNRKAMRELNWYPSYSLSDGLQETLLHFSRLEHQLIV